MGIGQGTIKRVLDESTGVTKNDNANYNILIGDVANVAPHEKTDNTYIESISPPQSVPEPQTSDPAPIPLSEYSSLDVETARLELERCQERNNYTGAAYLRNLLKERGTSDKPPVKKVINEKTVPNLFDWDFKTIYLRRKDISAHIGVSNLLTKDHPCKNISDDEVLRVDMEGNEITALSIIDKSYIFGFEDTS